MVREIKNNDMSEANAQAIAVVDFSATWCGPCKMLAPVLAELAQDMDGEVAFYSVDVDENMDLAQQFRVQSVPSLILLKNGEAVDMSIGFQPKPQLAAWINSHK